VLRFEDVCFSYGKSGKGGGDRGALKNISFEIRRGEFTALLGENGAGKSTLCRLCNGLLKPDAGRVLLAGEDTRRVKTSRLARRVGFLFQNPDRQLCQNTVRDEILLGLEYAVEKSGRKDPVVRAVLEERCEETLSLFGLDGSRDPFGLSRGERQQCALASVLARKPEFLILDEPTTGLDYRECVTIMGIIQDLHARGTTILMISHDMEIVADYARRALVLSEGRLIGQGPVREIMKNREILEKASLLPAQISALAMELGEGFEEVFTVEDMAGALVSALFSDSPDLCLSQRDSPGETGTRAGGMCP
jgi:energy-coupling factor transport system ATP-binding protein